MSSPTDAFADAAARVRPVDAGIFALAVAHQDSLAKPVGALGRLEVLGCRLAAMAGQVRPPAPEPAVAVLVAADHGVVAAGVTPWPQEVTGLMVKTIVAGGAASSVLARRSGAEIVVVDAGMVHPLEGLPTVLDRRVGPGSANLAEGPALTPEQVTHALDAGAALARKLVGDGFRCLVTGEMGIGNTTPAAAVIAALTGLAASKVTGRGTGIDDEGLARKTAIVSAAVARLAPGAPPHTVLAEVGGPEIAFLAGLMVGGAAAGVPVVLDGVITLAAALTAARLVPNAVDYWIAGHRPVEPGGQAVLAELGLDPLLDLGLRLGEGSGALLALPLVGAAAAVQAEMATLQEALSGAK